MSRTVDIPAGRIGPVHIHVSSNAKWYQRVTIKDNQECGYNQTFTGTGEGTVLGEVERDRNQAKSYEVKAEHSEDGGKTWKPNEIKYSEISTRSYPPIVIKTLSTEDGGGQDFDDSVIHFRYIDDKNRW
eukprot:Phypoly_transcript_20663.p1 GENE.Phypoly_transcript_20663~~Phypoly_transcript_20663.p1  ORF type:complete len:129 (+),score=14.01 Phypoly_transcript_20663:232-618(+)